MRVLGACSLGGEGHLRPLLGMLAGAAEQGAETLVLAPADLAGVVSAAGHGFRVAGQPPESQVAPIREALAVAPAPEAARLGNLELFGRLAAVAALPAMEQAIADWRPRLVLRDPAEYASAAVAHRLGIPTAQVAIGLAKGEWGSLEHAAPGLEELRAGLLQELRREPYLTRLPSSLDRSPFPDTRRYAPAAPATAPASALPASWWPGASPGAPLIYASLGTVLGYMTHAAGVYRALLEALGGLDARVLLTVGRRFDAATLGAPPANVRIEPWVDQRRVLAQAELVVSHGGSGTTFGALAAGIPVLAIPLFADQPANARRLAESGAGMMLELGSAPDGRRRLPGPGDGALIAAAVRELRSQSSYRARAAAIAAEMAGAPAAGARVGELLGGVEPTPQTI